MTSRTYSPAGKASMMLARLSDGPACFADLCQAAGAMGDKQRSKAHMVLKALREDAFVQREGSEGYGITPQGSAVLANLRAGEPVTVGMSVPNVRVFAPRPAP